MNEVLIQAAQLLSAEFGPFVIEGAVIKFPEASKQPTAAKIDEAKLTVMKARARVAIIARADQFTSPILSRYPVAERAGWDKREAEARSIIAASNKADAIAATKIIKALAQASGETTSETVERAGEIVAKADEFSEISAAVEIMRDQALSSIDAVTDPSDMDAALAALEGQAIQLAQQHGLL